MAIAGARAGIAERALRSCGRIGAGRRASLRCRAAGGGLNPRARSSRARSAPGGGARCVGRCAEGCGNRRVGGSQRRCGRKRVGGGRASAQPARTRGGTVRGGRRSARRLRIGGGAARGRTSRSGASSRSLHEASIRAAALNRPPRKVVRRNFCAPNTTYACVVYDLFTIPGLDLCVQTDQPTVPPLVPLRSRRAVC